MENIRKILKEEMAWDAEGYEIGLDQMPELLRRLAVPRSAPMQTEEPAEGERQDTQARMEAMDTERAFGKVSSKRGIQETVDVEVANEDAGRKDGDIDDISQQQLFNKRDSGYEPCLGRQYILRREDTAVYSGVENYFQMNTDLVEHCTAFWQFMKGGGFRLEGQISFWEYWMWPLAWFICFNREIGVVRNKLHNDLLRLTRGH